MVALAEQFTADRTDAACGKAIMLNIVNLTRVEEILASGLETFTPDKEAATEDRTPSGNVRGPAYFAEILDFKRKDRGNG